VLEAAKFKLVLDLKINTTLNALALITPRDELDEAESIEIQKMSDALIAEFGFDLQHLELAMEKFKVEENQEYVAFTEEMEDFKA
jgi:hypothetical protein